MENQKIVVDGMVLTPHWRVLYKDAWTERKNRGWWTIGTWLRPTEFTSKEDAVNALNELIRERSKGARTETMMHGGFGVDTVIDEDTANDQRIVDWKIQQQWRSKWTTDVSLEVRQ